MRTLKFIVENQQLRKDPNCDFSGLVPGSDGYLQAEFILSTEWRDIPVVASFWSVLGKEYEPKPLRSNGTCDIPAEALEKRAFKVQLIGKTKQNTRLTTNKLLVEQNG